LSVTIVGAGLLVGAPQSEAQIPLSGFNEMLSPSQGAIFTSASGVLTGGLSLDGSSIQYTLTYNFPDATPVQGSQYVNEAHLHFGQRHTSGGAIAYLCFSEGNATPVPPGTPPCPSPSGTVTGTLTAASIVGPSAQGISPGDFQKLIQAAVAGVVYGNVHTDRYPTGEIRGQIPGAAEQP
jgi:hypothetical protein